MNLTYRTIFAALWFSWFAYWLVWSRRVKRTERTEPFGSRLLHVVPVCLAVALLWSDRLPWAPLNARIFPIAPWGFWIGPVVTALGLLFTVWARQHLGGNWSGMITIKQSHDLITTGPYAMVRHPIYTGLLVAFIGTGLGRGEWRAVLAVLIVAVALWRKLRVEERWMSERFGQQYASYAQRVPALVPFWPGPF